MNFTRLFITFALLSMSTTVAAQNAPKMVVMPSSDCNISGTQGNAISFIPAQCTYTVSKLSGAGQINFNIDVVPPWLIASTMTGRTAATVIFSVNASYVGAQATGTQSGTIRFRNLTNPSDPAITRSSVLTVNATAPPPTASLTASPSSIQTGASATLAWSSTDAMSCTGTGFSTGDTTLGQATVVPTATTTYSIACTGASGTANASATVNVITQPPPETACTIGTNTFIGCYYDNADFTNLVLVRNDGPTFNFVWGIGSPDPAVEPETFSVKWEGNFSFETGTYRFTIAVDDGARLYLDDVLILDKWFDQATTTYQVDQAIAAGTHRVRMEMYENGGQASAALSWALISAPPPPPPPPPNCTVGQGTMTGCYYAGMNFEQLVLVRNDGAGFSFNWGTRSPDPTVPVDRFSVRWQGDITLAAGAWHFTTTADDGVRVYVDGALIIDAWYAQVPTTYVADVQLFQGIHRITMEFFEDGGGAVAALNWSPVGQQPFGGYLCEDGAIINNICTSVLTTETGDRLLAQ